MMGPIESMVIQAFGIGVRVDMLKERRRAEEFVELVYKARELDGNDGRCSHTRFTEEGPMNRCSLPNGHDGEHR